MLIAQPFYGRNSVGRAGTVESEMGKASFSPFEKITPI